MLGRCQRRFRLSRQQAGGREIAMVRGRRSIAQRVQRALELLGPAGRMSGRVRVDFDKRLV